MENIPKIRVVVRKRPLGQKEIKKGETDVLIVKDAQSLIVKEQKEKVDLTKYIEEHTFNFDNAYRETTTNVQLYSEVVRPLIGAAFGGAKVTCFAYGQTGSGKTFTMMGPGGDAGPNTGLYLLAAKDIFDYKNEYFKEGLSVRISFYEIYCGKLFDLLKQRSVLHAREDHNQKVVIMGLTEYEAKSVQELMKAIDCGLKARTTGVTGANSDSSRSHAVMQIKLVNKAPGKKLGMFSFIDLAGSERGADTREQDKQTRLDGAEINKSLLALKECIRALDQEKKHTPFRGSKLTQVLKDSFMGNCKTVMIANVSPCESSCEHTLNTLRYADRVKELKKPANGLMRKASLNPDELLAKQLYLPRQNQNIKRIYQNENKADDSPRNQPMAVLPKIVTKSDLESKNYKFLAQLSPRFAQRQNVNKKRSTSALPTKFHFPSLRKSDEQESFSQDHSIESSLAKNSSPLESPFSELARRKRPTKHKSERLDYIINSFKNQNEDDKKINSMYDYHERLVNLILDKEDVLINSHKKHMHEAMESLEEESNLIMAVDKPGSDLEAYLDKVEELMELKLKSIDKFKKQVGKFKVILSEERNVNSKLTENKGEILRDIFNIDKERTHRRSDNLLEDIEELF